MHKSTPHDVSLEHLVWHTDLVGENPETIEFIIKEGVWTPHYNKQCEQFADLILFYNYGTAIPVELKASWGQESKAKKQLSNTRYVAEQMFGKQVPYGKVVIYDQIHNGKIHFSYKDIMYS